MQNVQEVEGFGPDSGDDAENSRFYRGVRVALALYLSPVLVIVLIVGAVAVVLAKVGEFASTLTRALTERRWRFASGPFRAPRSSGTRYRLSTLAGARYGRYVHALPAVGEPSWSGPPAPLH